MSMTHSCVAQIFTARLEPAEHHEEESSMEIGHRAQMEAWSLKRLASRLLGRMTGKVHRSEAAELEAAVVRLAELSPHLLVDVGIDPETGLVAEEDRVLKLPRPVRAEEPAPVALPEPAVQPRRAARPRVQIPVPVPAARPQGA